MASTRKRTWTGPEGESKTAWVVDYVDGTGTRRNRQFSTKKAADAWKTNASWELSKGIHTADAASITVNRAAELWLDRAKREKLEHLTIKDYESTFRLHVAPVLGSKRLSELSKTVIEHFKDHLIQTRSRPMAKKVLRTLTSIIEEGVAKGMVVQNVARGVSLRRNNRDVPKAVIPTKTQLRAIIQAARASTHAMDAPLMVTAIFTGLRASELRGVRWADLDLDAARVTVRQRADRTRAIGSPKSQAGHRTIPLAAVVVCELRQWISVAPKSDLDLVFPTENGQVLDYKNLMTRHFNVVLVAAGVTKKRAVKADSPSLTAANKPALVAAYALHALRHAAASLWIEQRVIPDPVRGDS